MDSWKVLLVDDEIEFAAALAERLNLRGMTTTTANNGEEALRCMERDRPQLAWSRLHHVHGWGRFRRRLVSHGFLP